MQRNQSADRPMRKVYQAMVPMWYQSFYPHRLCDVDYADIMKVYGEILATTTVRVDDVGVEARRAAIWADLEVLWGELGALG